jgi:hypothetical protein
MAAMLSARIFHRLAGLPALLLLSACPDKDEDPDTATETAATEAATATTDATTGGATEATATTTDATTVTTTDVTTTDATTTTTEATTTDATTATTDTTGGPVFPLECGDLTCAEGQICVNPGDKCNYDLDPPDWVPQPSACQDVPPQCAELQDSAAQIMCIGEAHCINNEFGTPSELQDGVLQCADQGEDCF